MSGSQASTGQPYTVLDDGLRYETVELVLSTIPNFELKQKGRILHLFAEIYNAFIQEIQEALNERQDDHRNILPHSQANVSMAEPFIFESQINNVECANILLSTSADKLLQSSNVSDSNSSNETVPLLNALNEEETERKQSDMHPSRQQKSSGILKKDSVRIEKETIVPPRSKRRKPKTLSNSKRKTLSSISSIRQTTMTQLFDPIELPESSTNSMSVKQEPTTPVNDTMMSVLESLVGLAQPFETMSNNENEQNNLSDLISSSKEDKVSDTQYFKRKSISSPTTNNPILKDITTVIIPNESVLQSPYSGIESEELLYACPMCRNYWRGLPDELRRKEVLTCRHRQRPIARTPEHFWSLGIPSTQTCIQRGYGGVLPSDKPIERPRRPRRQYQRRLQERQLQQQNNEVADKE